MLSFVRIIKNELHKQGKLPDKWNDYGIGKLYGHNGNVLNISVNENVNYNLTDENGNPEAIYLCQEGLDPTKAWELKFKISLRIFTSSIPQDLLVALNGVKNNSTDVTSEAGSSYDKGLSYDHNYVGRFVIYYNISVYRCSITVPRTINPCTLEITYTHEEGNKNVAIKARCLENGSEATGNYELPSVSGWTLRPRLRTFADWQKCIAECYPKDFEFTYNGKPVFNH